MSSSVKIRCPTLKSGWNNKKNGIPINGISKEIISVKELMDYPLVLRSILNSTIRIRTSQLVQCLLLEVNG